MTTDQREVQALAELDRWQRYGGRGPFVGDVRIALALIERLTKPHECGADDIRAKGWVVAVHNDYRINGESRTFWLFTHPNGRWVKGEGATDYEALAMIRAQIAEEQATP